MSTPLEPPPRSQFEMHLKVEGITLADSNALHNLIQSALEANRTRYVSARVNRKYVSTDTDLYSSGT